MTREEEAELRDMVAMFNGDPPYNVPSNPCVGDGYFLRSIEKKFGIEFKTFADGKLRLNSYTSREG